MSKRRWKKDPQWLLEQKPEVEEEEVKSKVPPQGIKKQQIKIVVTKQRTQSGARKVGSTEGEQEKKRMETPSRNTTKKIECHLDQATIL